MPTVTDTARVLVLFVDDDHLVLNSLRRVLRGEPFVSVFMSDVAAVCDVVVNDGVDIVVTDHNMPVMNGLELLTQLRACAPNVVRVMLTGQSRNDGQLAVRDDDLVHHLLMKPWDNTSLKQFLRDLVDGIVATRSRPVPRSA